MNSKPSSSAAAKKLFFPLSRRSPSQIARRRLLPAVNFADWDPDRSKPSSAPEPSCSPPSSSAAARSLSPIARYICDSLRRHGGWSPGVLSDLRKLRRVPPDLVAEVLKVQSDPIISSRFFHWAGKQKGYRHSYVAYNALAHCLGRAGRHRAADQVVELMAAQGRPPSEKQFEILIRMHADAGRGLHVHYLFDKMRQKFQLTPRVFFYNRVMEALVNSGHVDLALSVYRSFIADGLKEESVTFMVLAKGLCKAGRVEEALELLGKMRMELCRPDIFAYTAMLKVAAAAGVGVDGCRRIWAAMAEDQVNPDAMAYTLMVNTLCAAGDPAGGLKLFREMKGKGLLVDRAVYGALVEALVAGRKLAAAGELAVEMVGDGYRADGGIYTSLIVGSCAAGRRDKAWKLLRAAVNDGVSPGPEAVNPLLAAFTSAGEANKAAAAVGVLAAADLPVISILEAFFLAVAGDGDRALTSLDLFEKLRKRGFHSVAMYSSLISSLHRAKQPEKSISLFSGMSAAGDLRPDSHTFSSVIPCFVAAGDLPAACECYNKMKELSWAPSAEAYRSLVQGLCRSGEIAGAVGMVGDCLANVTNGPREFKYALAALHASRRGGGAAEVIAVLDEMEEEGVRPEEAVCAAVIHGFCRSGGAAAGGAKEVLAAMEKKGLITAAEHVAYEEMLAEHLKRTAAGLMLSGLKFFGLESKLKLTSELAYRH